MYSFQNKLYTRREREGSRDREGTKARGLWGWVEGGVRVGYWKGDSTKGGNEEGVGGKVLRTRARQV